MSYLAPPCKQVMLPYQTHRKVYGVIGQSVSLKCKPTGTNPITIRWLKSGHQVNTVPGDVEVLTSGLLKFINYREDQGGDYTCQVSNCNRHIVDAEVSLVTASKAVIWHHTI